MQRFSYIILASIKYSTRNRAINLITIMSFTIGMFFSTFIFVMGSSILKDLNNTKIEYMNNIVKVQGYRFQDRGFDQIPIEDFQQIINKYNQLDGIEAKISSYEFVVHNEQCDLTRSVVYVTHNFVNLYHDFICNGKWFEATEFNDELECILGSNVSLAYFGKTNPLMQKVEINNKVYKIIGITENSKYYDSIIVPITQYKNVSISDISEYYFMFKSNNRNYDDIKKFINEKYGSYNFVELDKKYISEYERILKGAITIFIVSFVVLLFSIINTMGIFIHRINESKKRIATQIAFGAKKSDIYLQNYIEICILAFISSIIVYGIVLAVSNIPGLMPVQVNLDISVLVMLGIVSIIVSVLISIILLFQILKLQVNNIFRG